MTELQKQAMAIIADPTLTHEQAAFNLSALPGATEPAPFSLPDGFAEMLQQGLLCDLNEGTMPYAPRYILPDYEKLMREGCRFLRLEPPQTLAQAIQTLLIFYRHVPSVTHYPVYLGSVDKLLEPFIEDEADARAQIRDFLFFISRTIPDSYCHMNLGPEATRAGEYILDAELELCEAIPAITLLYDEAVTPDAFAEKALQCALACAKPSFANHAVYAGEAALPYGIASCYNALAIGGGAFTLSRGVLSRIAQKAKTQQDFFETLLPAAVKALCAFMEEKIRFLVEKSHFFTSSFLVQEGFLHQERFTGMLGVVGLCECVNTLNDKEGIADRYAHSEQADQLAHRVMDSLRQLVQAFPSQYCDTTGHHFVLHAQVGIDRDIGISPGARIAVGDEIGLYDHLRHAGQFHPYFPSGAGDIFPFEETAKNNPSAMLDIIKGSFRLGLRYFSAYASNSDVVRITGYLVKRSDLEKLAAGQAVPQANATWGLGAARNNKALQRKVHHI